MNAKPLRLLFLIAAMSLASCTDPRANSISRLHHADAVELRTEVTRLYTKLFPASGPAMVPVRPELWPAVLLKLRPLRMNLYRDGLAVSLQASPGFEYGLHILPAGATERMESTERTQYEKLQEGIYYFTQKR